MKRSDNVNTAGKKLLKRKKKTPYAHLEVYETRVTVAGDMAESRPGAILAARMGLAKRLLRHVREGERCHHDGDKHKLPRTWLRYRPTKIQVVRDFATSDWCLRGVVRIAAFRKRDLGDIPNMMRSMRMCVTGVERVGGIHSVSA